MKRLALLVTTSLALLVATSSVRAEKLRIYSDAGLSDSTLTDGTPRTANFYVVHTATCGSTGIRFSVAPTIGFTGVWIGETTSYGKLGQSATDLSIGYGACLTGPIAILTMTYQLFGTSAACSALNAAPPPGFPCVVATSFCGCLDEYCVYDIGGLRVNCPVATEPTTWGSVKALYR